MTNWPHPDVRAVRAVLLGVMLASLVVSATLPGACWLAGGLLSGTARTCCGWRPW
ncbi:MAG TPA: hypothetical protein VFX16_07555 [Pseudonocardiaceae bacterium]|nr:hypothetical protein [Pseudonocardiaceae bacterium]